MTEIPLNKIYTLSDIAREQLLGVKNRRTVAKILRNHPDIFEKPRGKGTGTQWFILGSQIINYRNKYGV